MFLAELILLTLVVAAVLGPVVLRRVRQRVFRPNGDVLIVASHQDDCLILGGELALAAIEGGHTVTIAYLTCGDTEPGTPRAEQRAAEARRVWTEAGARETDLHFFGLPQTELGQPSRWTPAECNRAAEELKGLFAAARLGTTVVLPAAYESHIDHRTTRVAALTALAAVDRRSLQALERAEYNTLYHAIDNPYKVLRLICDRLPLVPRITRRMISRSDGGFSTVSVNYRLKADPERARRKQRLMSLFSSEYNLNLASLAEQPEIYRRVTDHINPKHGTIDVVPPRWLTVGGRAYHWSTCTAVGLALVTSALFTMELMEHVRIATGAGHTALAGLAGALAVGEMLRRRRSLGRVLLLAAFLTGLALSLR